MVSGLKIISIKNAIEIKVTKIHIHWLAKQRPVQHYSPGSSPQ